MLKREREGGEGREKERKIERVIERKRKRESYSTAITFLDIME